MEAKRSRLFGLHVFILGVLKEFQERHYILFSESPFLRFR